MSTSGKGGNVYDASANALSGAGGAYQAASDLYSNPGLTGNAATVKNPATIASGISTYMNPYTQDVIDRSLMNLDTTRKQQLAQVGADASAVGAFGGSRQGVVEALTNSEAQKNAGDLSATLLNNAWTTAAGLSGQDIANKMQTGEFNANTINQWKQAKSADELARAAGLTGVGGAAEGLGGLTFGIGNQINSQQSQVGSLQQQLIQQILSGGQGQYETAMGQPQNLLNMQLAALGMNPLTTATTTSSSYQPGLMDFLGLGVQGLGAWRMGA